MTPSILTEPPIQGKYLNFKRSWIKAHEYFDEATSVEDIIKTIKAVENSNVHHNELVFVNCMIDFKPLYVSKNIEQILGYTQDEFLSWGSKAYFNISALDQPDFWTDLMNWENEAKRSIPSSETYIKGRGFYCGISQILKDGTSKRFLSRHETVFGKNFEVPKYIILYFEDITPFFNGNEYWMLFQNFTNQKMHTKFYKKSGVDNNIITDREKEVLVLIGQGKTTKEISSLLGISTLTVSQHRKNMIRRTGAKDTSALIHFCKICEVI